MIAITTYTEPVPIDAVVSDPLKPNENEETEERSSFSELLAGLLQTQSEKIVSDSGLDALSAGQLNDGGKLDLSAETQEVDLEACDLELTDESQNILLSADQLFTSLLETDVSGENGLSLETDRAKSLINEIPLQTVSFAEKGQDDAAAQLKLLQEINEIAQMADNKKKANTQSKIDSEDALSAKNKVGEGKDSLLAKTNEGKEQPGKLEEFRNRSRKDKVNIEVRDYRTVSNNSDGTQTRGYSVVETAVGRNHGQNAVQEVTLDLRLPDQGQSSQLQNSWEVKSGNMLENMLARELHQNFNGDIVRHASMALRDGGAGTIKIALHPETLGHVKIHLEMTENKITGRIVVESEEALNAFRKELSALEQAFKDSGYANADLNLSLTADGSSEQGQNFDESSFSSRMAASSYEDGFELESAPVISVIFRRGSGSVNMLA
ncbi:flagellar hook-length control protein FliK [Treponema sp. R6D11]